MQWKLQCTINTFFFYHFNSLSSLSWKQLILGELKVFLAISITPTGHPLSRLHLGRVVEAEIVITSKNHSVTLNKSKNVNKNGSW